MGRRSARLPASVRWCTRRTRVGGAAIIVTIATIATIATGDRSTTETSGSGPGGRNRPVRSFSPVGARSIAQHRRNEACTRVGKAQAARLEDVAPQEETGQREGVGNFLR